MITYSVSVAVFQVDAVKKQCNQNLTRLMEEIHTLELENSEKQAEIDRALREKRAVESELEKVSTATCTGVMYFSPLLSGVSKVLNYYYKNITFTDFVLQKAQK